MPPGSAKFLGTWKGNQKLALEGSRPSDQRRGLEAGCRPVDMEYSLPSTTECQRGDQRVPPYPSRVAPFKMEPRLHPRALCLPWGLVPSLPSAPSLVHESFQGRDFSGSARRTHPLPCELLAPAGHRSEATSCTGSDVMSTAGLQRVWEKGCARSLLC